MAKVDVIFVAQIRTPELFKQSIEELSRLKEEGWVENIIFSTWNDELPKYPGFKDYLDTAGVRVIESNEPVEKGPGNMWSQMASIEISLNASNKDNFILKTRPDVHINSEFLKKIFTEKEILLNITKNLPKGNVFEYKIWVPWFEITKPFYMADECFFGHYEDIKKLVNYDKRFDEDYDLGIGRGHIRRFITPFLEKYPELLESISKHKEEKNVTKKSKFFALLTKKVKPGEIGILRYLALVRRFNYLKKNLKDENYQRYLAQYYSILHSHFYIDSSSFPDLIVWRDYSKPNTKIDPTSIERSFNKKNVIYKHGGQIFAHDLRLVENVINKTIEKTSVSEKIMDAVDKFNQN